MLFFLILLIQTLLIWSVGTNSVSKALVGGSEKNGKCVSTSPIKSAIIALALAILGVWFVHWRETKAAGGMGGMGGAPPDFSAQQMQ